MIVRLTGTLLSKKPPEIILEVANIGYEILIPMSTLYKLPEIGKTITLVTHLIIREDSHQLYGFYIEQEKIIFKKLIKISGVGPRMALAILSGIAIVDLINCIDKQDINPLLNIPGIGKKTAQRLLIEMQGKFDEISHDNNLDKILMINNNQQAYTMPKQEAITALISLGYKSKEATSAVQAIYEEGLNTEHLIRKALKKLF